MRRLRRSSVMKRMTHGFRAMLPGQGHNSRPVCKGVKEMNQRADTHSKAVGYLLWIFGFTGSHRFYFGKPISGTIWFFTFGLFLVGWFIDLFLIPGMDRRADAKFIEGPKDYTVAWALLTFLGMFGAHRFYIGKIGTGIIWLLTLGLFGIGYLYDLWTLNGQVSEANGRSVAR